MANFEYRSTVNASSEDLYRYHLNPGAFQRLTPPWEPVEVAEKDDGINEGTIRNLKVGPKPFQMSWKALHESFVENSQFVDRQLEGPFRSWSHLHKFERLDEDRARLNDLIEYELPLQIPAAFLVDMKLRPMFRYRHRQTARDLATIALFPGPLRASASPLTVGVTGAGGFVGSRLASLLEVAGHKVRRLTRGHQSRPGEAVWWPEPDLSALEGMDAVVHLAGEPVAQLWTKAVKEKIYYSRVEGTKRLCRALSDLKSPPKTLISTSATGFYKQQSDHAVDETAPPGEGFLSEVCQDWEAATEVAQQAGMRVCRLRIGLVVGAGGGFLAPQLPAFRLGLGAVLGDGRQKQSFVDLDDVVGAIYHLLHRTDLQGVFNGTAPNPVTQAQFARRLAEACSRPLWMKIPEAPVRAFLKEQADMLFEGVAAMPTRLTESGYKFLAPTLGESLEHHLSLPDGHLT
jgi:uncharacterized protein (TIGR01777 family)